MPQAIVDPAALRLFAHNLKQFNNELQNQMATLHGQLLHLSSTWRDQEQQKFTEEFEQTMQAISRFIEATDEHIPFLMRKAERVEEYLQQREERTMSESARVLSIDVVKDFQASLCTFCEDAREALCAVDMEASRVLDWVVHEQLNYWQRAIRDREDDLAHAKAELYRRQLARLSGEKPDCIEQEEAVWLAQDRLREAEEKVEKCRQWGRLLERAIEEYQAPAQQLGALVEGDPPRAVIFLEQVLARLDAYVGLAPSSASSTPATAPAPAGEAVAKPAARPTQDNKT